MHRINSKIWFLFFLMLSGKVIFSKPIYYNFSKTLTYNFGISGDISFSYSPEEENHFEVMVKGTLEIKKADNDKDKYILEVIPSKTFVKINEMVIEDITKSETEISRIVSKVKIKMKKNGEILEVIETDPKIVNIGKFLSLIPVLPEREIVKGKIWQQQISSFEIPGFLKMCNLKFTYSIKDIKKDKYYIDILSNQIINEEEKDRDIKIRFTGTNMSKGTFIFNSSEGKIEKFNGTFNLKLKVFFTLPPSPGNKTTQSMPMDLKVNLNTSLNLVD